MEESEEEKSVAETQSESGASSLMQGKEGKKWKHLI